MKIAEFKKKQKFLILRHIFWFIGGLKQKYAEKCKNQMKYPQQFQKQSVLQIENLSAAGNFKHKREMSLGHKPLMRQKNSAINEWIAGYNIVRIALYYKRINSHFPFSYIIRSVSEVLHIGMKWRCFILWSLSGLSRRNEMNTETMLQPSSLCYAVPSLKRRFMKHGCAV